MAGLLGSWELINALRGRYLAPDLRLQVERYIAHNRKMRGESGMKAGSFLLLIFRGQLQTILDRIEEEGFAQTLEAINRFNEQAFEPHVDGNGREIGMILYGVEREE